MQIAGEGANAARSTALARSALARAVQEFMADREDCEDVVPALNIYRRTKLTMPISALYYPSLSIVVRGSKRVLLGDQVYLYDQTQFLVTAVDVPTISEVVEASEASPYLSVLLRLDLDLTRSMMTELGMVADEEAREAPCIGVGVASAELYHAVNRLLALRSRPDELKVIGALIQKEIIFRLLQSEASERLRQIVSIGNRSNRIAQVITYLRENFNKPLKIEDLAQQGRMAVSTLHHHFREMTAMSPLQYQKMLRLHTARRMMLNEEVGAQTAGILVGYESITQFNREYRRMFGAPPARDIRLLRTSGIETMVA